MDPSSSRPAWCVKCWAERPANSVLLCSLAGPRFPDTASLRIRARSWHAQRLPHGVLAGRAAMLAAIADETNAEHRAPPIPVRFGRAGSLLAIRRVTQDASESLPDGRCKEVRHGRSWQPCRTGTFDQLA